MDTKYFHSLVDRDNSLNSVYLLICGVQFTTTDVYTTHI